MIGPGVKPPRPKGFRVRKYAAAELQKAKQAWDAAWDAAALRPWPRTPKQVADAAVQKFRLQEAERAGDAALQAPLTPKQLARVQEIARQFAAPTMTPDELAFIDKRIAAESGFDTKTDLAPAPSPGDPIFAFLLTLPHPLKRADALAQARREFRCSERVFSFVWVQYPTERKLHGAPKGRRLPNKVRRLNRK